MPDRDKRPVWHGGLSSDALKVIAMVSMLIDHIGAVVLARVVFYRGPLVMIGHIMGSQWGDILQDMLQASRTIGRIAFPIYGFLLAEGFLHTRDWRRYWLRLAAFAVISELPFDLAIWNGWTGQSRNVFIELALGLLVLQGLRMCEKLPPASRMAASAIAIGAGCAAALLIKADYDMDGILMISAFYLLRDSRRRQALWGGALAFLESWDMYRGAGVLAVIPIFLYNGEKGTARHKYIFYCFYPIHLLVLFAIRRFAIGIPLG